MHILKKASALFLSIFFVTPMVKVQAFEDEYKVITKEDTFFVEDEGLSTLSDSILPRTFSMKSSKVVTKEYDTIVKKTSANYEVILAKGDKVYTYADKADTYEEAVEKADKLREENPDDFSMVPSVLSSSGVITYATESIGRVWKEYVSGYTGTKDSLSYVYSDSALKNPYTYINDGYISEVPLIEVRANEAKVLVNGYEGWMNTNINRNSNRDLRIVPMTDVKYSCYYFVENGILKQRVVTSITTGAGSTQYVGVAPSYLVAGKKYVSYDGNYFYDATSSLQNGLTNLTKDLQNGTKSLAVNKSNPYYAYYKYLPFRTKTNYTASEINKFIENNTSSDSKLRGMGQAFINYQNEYGVNALLALGVAINESAWGKSEMAMTKNNLFGLKAYDNDLTNASGFEKPEYSILDFTKNYISNGYSNPKDWRYYGGFLGDKHIGVNVKYASDPYWGIKAASYAVMADYEMSGKNIANMKDYNYYQLVMYKGTGKVYNSSSSELYSIASAPRVANQSHVGSVAALVRGNKKTVSGKVSYEIFPEITSAVSAGTFSGSYSWNTHGYVDTSIVKTINTGKTRCESEDLNMDGKVDAKDLSLLAQSYNSTSSSKEWNKRYDINGDGIIDLYDMVKIARKL